MNIGRLLMGSWIVLGAVTGVACFNKHRIGTGDNRPMPEFAGYPLNVPPHRTFGLALGDVTGDGQLDALVADPEANVVLVFLPGDRATDSFPFSPRDQWSTGPHPTSVAVGDFNKNGLTDFVAGHDGGITVMLDVVDAFDGIYEIQEYPSAILGSDSNHHTSLAVGDLDGDGDSDIAALTQLKMGGVSVFLNKGDGTFAPCTDYMVGWWPEDIAIADMNGDHIGDLVAALPSPVAVEGQAIETGIAILPGQKNGTLGPVVKTALGSRPYELEVGDLDGDGMQDIATTSLIADPLFNARTGAVEVLLNRGGGTFTAVKMPSLEIGDTAFGLELGDVNGDGAFDVLASAVQSGTADWSPRALHVLINDRTGKFTLDATYPLTSYPVSPDFVAVADVDGDHISDIVLAGGAVVQIPGLGNGTFLHPPQKQFTERLWPCAFADLDADGHDDIVATDGADVVTGSGLQLWFGDAKGGFSAVALPGATGDVALGGQSLPVVTADFNHDGKVDLAIAEGNGTVVYLNKGARSFELKQQIMVPSNIAGRIFSADMNRDGKLDLISGMILPGNGDGTFQVPSEPVPGGGLDSLMAVADLDGDGKPDLVSGGSGDTGGVIGLRLSSRQTPVLLTLPAEGGVGDIVATDMDADDDMDLVAIEALGSTMTVFENMGAGIFSYGGMFWGGAGGRLRAADLNGDALPELIVGDRIVTIVGNLSFSVFGGGHRSYVGGDYAYLSDMDHDGKSDLVTLSGGNGLVWLRNLSP